MLLKQVLRYRHASPFSERPALVIDLEREEGEAAALSDTAIAALMAAAPALQRFGQRGPSSSRSAAELLRSDQGCFFALALIAYLLQQEHSNVRPTMGTRSAEGRLATVYVAYDDWVLGLAAARAALAPANALVREEPQAFAEALRRALRHMADNALSLGTSALAAAASERGIPWQRVGPGADVVQLGWGTQQRLLSGGLIDPAAAVGTRITGSRAALLARLAQLNLPASAYRCVDDPAEAVQAAAELGGRVVLTAAHRPAKRPADRPVDSVVAVESADAAAVGRAYAAVAEAGQVVVVERQAGGERYELLIANDRLVAALRRSDGKQGADIDVTGRVNGVNASAALLALQALSLPIGIVAIRSRDIAKPWNANGAVIEAISPATDLSPFLAFYQHRPLATALLDGALPQAYDGRIPVAAVTGSHGKTTTCRMTSAILATAGPGVGNASSDGVQLDGRWLAVGDYAGPNGADLLFRQPRVRAAVLETARGGILKRGFAFDACDVAAVTYVDSIDHLGLHGVESLEELAAVKARLVRFAKRAVVLNLADPLTRAMAKLRQPGTRLIWVVPPDGEPGSDLAPFEEVESAERIVVAEWQGAAWIVLQAGGSNAPIAEVASLPATEGGSLTFNVANACFAAGVALGLGMSVAQIAQGLRDFRLDATSSFGRWQMIEGAGRSVLVDYAHNPKQYRTVTRILSERYPDRRKICAFVTTGDRSETFIDQETAALAGRYDRYICFEREAWRRSRPEGWIAGRLTEGLVDHGVAATDIDTELSQEAALDRLFERSTTGDLLVVLGADSFAAVRRIEQTLARLEREAEVG